jgi:phage terminase large subunit-like protein
LLLRSALYHTRQPLFLRFAEQLNFSVSSALLGASYFSFLSSKGALSMREPIQNRKIQMMSVTAKRGRYGNNLNPPETKYMMTIAMKNTISKLLAIAIQPPIGIRRFVTRYTIILMRFTKRGSVKGIIDPISI